MENEKEETQKKNLRKNAWMNTRPVVKLIVVNIIQ